MPSVLTGVEFKIPAFVGLVLFIGYVRMVRKPSVYGWLMALLCVYLPASEQFPLSVGPGLNLLNGFFVLLFVVGRWQRIEPGTDSVKTAGFLWSAVCILAGLVALTRGGTAGAVQTMELMKRWLEPVLLYIFGRRLTDEADRGAAMDGILTGTVLFSVHLLLQGLDIGDKVRVGGLMGQANQAASFVAAYTPVLVSVAAASSVLKMAALLGGLLVCGVAELQTVSRGGLIGLVVGVVVAASLSGRRSLKAVTWSVALVLLLSPAVLPDKVFSRFQGRDMKGNDNREAAVSSETRRGIWDAAMAMGLANPLGVGLGQFPSRVAEYGGPAGRDAHSVYLLVWAEMGWGGLFVFLGLVFQLSRRGLRGLRTGRDLVSRTAGLALVGGMASLVTTNLFSATVRNGSVFGYAWILAAIIARTTTESGRRSDAHQAADPHHPVGLPDDVGRIGYSS